MTKKFAAVAANVAALEAAAKRVEHFKVNTKINSRETPNSLQVSALKNLFRRMGINTLVTAKVGTWMKRLILTDVIINYYETQTQCRNGEEAYELAQLMTRAMNAVKIIIETNLPGLKGHFCPHDGIVDGNWRYQ